MRAEFESIRSGFLGVNVYGPSTVKIKKMYHSFVNKNEDFGYLISQLIACKVWDREDELFNPYSNYGNFGELETVYMPKSSFGFGILALKNISFDKIYNIKLFDKEIGKEFFLKEFLF